MRAERPTLSPASREADSAPRMTLVFLVLILVVAGLALVVPGPGSSMQHIGTGGAQAAAGTKS
jgi:hypothetical protein